jgi:nitrate/nitrite-specific signal transduction histidine kinase
VTIRQEKSEAFAPRNDLQKKFLISGSVALAVVLAWALVVGQTLSQPLRRLARASRRIAGGDLDHSIAVAGKDEVGQLGSAFETMRHALKQSRQEVEERSRAVATLEERDRIAREMHDSLSQTLGYVWLTVSASKERLETGDISSVREQLEEVRQAARDAYEDVRQGIWALRTNGILEKGLLPTLKEFLDHYSAQTKLQVRLTLPPSLEIGLSEAAQVQALRIIQEALANVRKHAQASRVLIEFTSRRGWVHIAIEDDGRGFDASAASASGQHYGLQIMRERAQRVGGALDVFSRAGESTRIVVRLPTSGLSKER